MRLRGFQNLTPVEEALQRLLGKIQIKKLNTEIVPLNAALNRVLAEDIVALEDLPRFDRSAVDGYALRAEDTFEASQFKPKILRVVTEKAYIDAGEAKQVWTGNPIPKGANAVVMLENTKRTNNEIEVWITVTPGENISKRGEDVPKGVVAIKAGVRLKPQHLGLAAALGMTAVKVFEKPKIAILATGDELVSANEKPQENQVFDANRAILSALCRELDAEPMDLGIAKDDINQIIDKIRVGLEGADLVITTGGTSVGSSDLVPEAVNKIGKPGVIVHGVAMRPAMPTGLAVVNGKPIILLSGNPVAAMVGFEVFARPLTLKMLGIENEPRPVVTARLTRRTSTALGRKTFVRVRVFQRNGEFYAEPIS
ncbi:MAG: molybdopterin molybdotransferase MoeA, partial [Candidatus Bathyarchaeia archaeon]